MTLRLRNGQLPPASPTQSPASPATASATPSSTKLQMKTAQMDELSKSTAGPVIQPCPACEESKRLDAEIKQLDDDYAAQHAAYTTEKGWYDASWTSDVGRSGMDFEKTEADLKANRARAATLRAERATLKRRLESGPTPLRGPERSSNRSAVKGASAKPARSTTEAGKNTSGDQIATESRSTEAASAFGTDEQTSEGGTRIDIPSELPGLPPPGTIKRG